MMNLAQRSAAQEKRRRKKALMRLISHRRFSHLAAHEGLELLERARPVRSQEPGQTAIGKNFSASLASSTIIRFVVGVANPLNLFSTSGAGLAIASVNGHVLAKRSDVFGKATFCLPETSLRFARTRSEEHTSELQSRQYLVCRLLLEKKKK